MAPSPHVLLRIIQTFGLRFVEGVPYLLLEGLDTGDIDLAVMVDPEPRASLVLQPLVTEQEYLIGTNNATMPGPVCEIENLAGLPLILLPPPSRESGETRPHGEPGQYYLRRHP